MTSPYSSGGGGTFFEAKVAAYYMAAALCRAPARGILGNYVTQVATQRAAFDDPLDDIIVSSSFDDGRQTKLSLQVKTSLSFTSNDEEWKAVVHRSWDTYRGDRFSPELHRIGVGFATYSAKVDQHLQAVLSWASKSANAADFFTRITKQDFSHQTRSEFVSSLRTLIEDHNGAAVSDDDLWSFIKSFVILHFDFQNEDSSRDAEQIQDRLHSHSVSGAQDQARRAWDFLFRTAADLIPVAGSATRDSLLAKLSAEGIAFNPAIDYLKAIRAINEESQLALQDIKPEIGGLRIHRAEAHLEVRSALGESRFVQIIGEPGTGKSALLREIAQETERFGPIIVLKDRRVRPGGWLAHAHVLGIGAPVTDLLREFACAGEPILFIDGIDRIVDPARQLTINDIIRALVGGRMSNWRVLATVRENNLQHLETWLDPDAMRALSVQTVRIGGLSSAELRVVGEAYPQLRPLLIEGAHLDAILKRPFFLEALRRISTDASVAPATEAQLLKTWWELGGADRSDFANAQARRNALLALADRVARKPQMDISIRDIAEEALHSLRESEVIRDAELGHTVSFAHDIYEEWALCELLIGTQGSTIEFLKQVGEPQSLARPLQLLSTYILEGENTPDHWAALLDQCSGGNLRPIWRRSVLSAPLHSTRSTELLVRCSPRLMANDVADLRLLLLALRTLEVIPNRQFLDEKVVPGIDAADRVRFANYAAVPKVLLWVRFLDWFIPQLANLPKSLLPDIIPVLATWRNAAGFMRIRYGKEIGAFAHECLIEFEKALHPRRLQYLRKPFNLTFGNDDDEKLEKDLRALFLQSAGDVPELVSKYLGQDWRDSRRSVRHQIVENCTAAVVHIPQAVVNFVLEAYLENPEDPRKQDPFGSYIDHVVDHLGISDDQTFYPASPIRLPFLLLLRNHEEEGLQLIRKLCNHSIFVWRWACQHDQKHQPLKPIPIPLEFPWGTQECWGTFQTYTWFRGIGHGNHAVHSAMMALEQWALEEIDKGRPFDEIFRKVVEDNDSVAALGVAVSISLAHPVKAIPHALPLILCPMLWEWDIARSIHEYGSHANEIANWQSYRVYMEAVRALNQKPHRKSEIRSLTTYFVLWHDEAVREKYVAGIRDFENRLPFSFKHEADDREYAEELKKKVKMFSEQGDPRYFRAKPAEDGKHTVIWNEPPSLEQPEIKRQQEDHAFLNKCAGLALWAQKSLDGRKIEATFTLEEASRLARELDHETLFDSYHGSDDLTETNRAAGVAGTAYVLAEHFEGDARLSEVLPWCIGVFSRASLIVEQPDALSYRGAAPLMHPAIFAAEGYSALLRRNVHVEESKKALLNLSVDPMEGVEKAVFKATCRYAANHPEFVRFLIACTSYRLAKQRDFLGNIHQPFWDEIESASELSFLEWAENELDKGTVPQFASVPMPWVKDDAPIRRPRDRETQGYRRNETLFLSRLAGDSILEIPLEVLDGNPAWRTDFLSYLRQLLEWTIQETTPPFCSRRRENRGNTPFEWVYSFSSWCGKLSARLSTEEVQSIFLDRMFATDNETALLLMQNFVRGFMIYGVLLIERPNTALWDRLTTWIFENEEWHVKGRRRYLENDYVECALATLFCAPRGVGMGLICGIEPGWRNLSSFRLIIERAVRQFGTDKTLYYGVTTLLSAGGFDLLPDPALEWVREIATSKRQDLQFWNTGENGENTVDILKRMLSEKADALTDSNRKAVIEISDILVDNGVRGAGFLQQEMNRSRS